MASHLHCATDRLMGELAAELIESREGETKADDESLEVTDESGGLSVTAIVSAEADSEDGESIVDMVTLHIVSGPLCVHVSLGATHRFDDSAWRSLAAGEDAAMHLTQTNGEVSVTSGKGLVTFAVARYGGSDDSEITVHGPVALFARIFTYIGQRVATIHASGQIPLERS